MTFTPEIYEAIDAGCERSAAVIVPLVYDLIRPKSVIDVGCGTARFARAFAAIGCAVAAVDESVGDGSQADGVLFFRRTLPTDLGKRDQGSRLSPGYDLAVCLEVAEHLPEAASGVRMGPPAVPGAVLCLSLALVLWRSRRWIAPARR